eukprot:6470809-Amphidinium_carterae.1
MPCTVQQNLEDVMSRAMEPHTGSMYLRCCKVGRDTKIAATKARAPMDGTPKVHGEQQQSPMPGHSTTLQQTSPRISVHRWHNSAGALLCRRSF